MLKAPTSHLTLGYLRVCSDSKKFVPLPTLEYVNKGGHPVVATNINFIYE